MPAGVAGIFLYRRLARRCGWQTVRGFQIRAKVRERAQRPTFNGQRSASDLLGRCGWGFDAMVLAGVRTREGGGLSVRPLDGDGVDLGIGA